MLEYLSKNFSLELHKVAEMLRMLCLYLVLLVASVFSAEEGCAFFSKEQPIHHQFNAQLLQPDESQVSMYGNFKYGLSETLEVGAQALPLLDGGFNLAVKHRMFEIGEVKTAFTSHSYFWNKGGRFFMIAPTGVVSDFAIQDRLNLNLGFFDTYVSGRQKEGNINGSLHYFSALLGSDWILSSDWGFTGFAFLPLYAVVQMDSDHFELEGQYQLYRGQKQTMDNFFFGFVGVTKSWRKFNFEFGSLVFGRKNMPYVNLFWRFL